MGGAFQISREIFENEIWTDIVKFRIFFYILGKAVFSQEGITQAGIHIERGQYLRSLRNLQDDLAYREGRGNSVKKYPLTTIQRKIKSLEKEKRITTKSTEYGTLFTVLNYAKYQGLSNYKNQSMEQERNSDGTAMEQRWNNNNNANNANKDLNVVVGKGAREKRTDLDDVDHIADYYMVRRGRPGQAPKVPDYQSIKATLSAGVPVEEVLRGIDQAFDNYKPKFPDDEISTFGYCKKIILSNFYANQERKEAAQYEKPSRSYGQSPEEGRRSEETGSYYDQYEGVFNEV